ncbi:ATP-binding cassette domain-containing protein [uncultured Deinococcus sp.]|uniref:amino acid ABC transporter ATP-binding/permease protein n=1 Tax=uncultured Deinococcus sp. TaxID=158789 RepID=UPI00258ECBE3|nr:ATP-binding cassette domain-containing protein [uncultured Deinococcus sp.]
MKGAALLAALAALCGVFLAATSGVLISRAALRPEVFLSLGVLATAVRALGLGRAGLRYAERLRGHAAALRLGERLRLGLFDRFAASGRTLTTERSGDLLARAGEGVDARQFRPLRVTLPLVAFAAAVLVWSGWLLTLDAGLAGLAAMPLLLAALGVLALRGPAARAARQDMALTQEHGTLLLDTLAAGGEGAALRRPQLAALAAAQERAALTLARLGLAVSMGQGAAFAVALVGTLWRGAALVDAGELSGPLLAAAVLGTAAAFDALSGLAAVPGAQARADLATEQDAQTLAAPPAAPAAPRPLPAGPLTVELRGVTLRRGERAVLDGAALTLYPGERVALTGESGGGKTTLLRLIARDLDPDGGAVLVSGTDLRDLDPAAWRGALSLHEQHAPVLDGTLRENLRLGDPAATEARLRALLDDLGLAHLPLDNWVGEGGTRLSGGERARVSLARALLRPSPLLLLDEPTAHLDPDTEAQVLAVLEREAAGRTLLLVTHRPAPLALAERVLELRGGQLWPLHRLTPAPPPPAQLGFQTEPSASRPESP